MFFFFFCLCFVFFFFQAEDGIRDLVRSRGLGDVYKRQIPVGKLIVGDNKKDIGLFPKYKLIDQITDAKTKAPIEGIKTTFCLLYTSDAADERSSVDLGGRRIIKKKKKN